MNVNLNYAMDGWLWMWCSYEWQFELEIKS
jgi:hypothetical protein